ncbi:unnamed protein product, partial [Owenia fusiformis]
ICSDHNDCLSGACQDNLCVECGTSSGCSNDEFCSNSWECLPKLHLNQICYENVQCLSGLCNRNICVECEKHHDCQNGYLCINTNTETLPNSCSIGKEIGEPCSVYDECFSMVCEKEKCVECWFKWDCPDGHYCANVFTNLESFCDPQLKYGDSCLEDEWCESSICYEGFCADCHNDPDCNTGEYCEQSGDFTEPNKCVLRDVGMIG